MPAVAYSAPAPRFGWRTAAVAAACYVASLIATVPASMLAKALALATGGTATLEGARGSLWSGSAEAIVILGRFSTGRYELLRWKWEAAPLIEGRIAFLLEVAGPRLSGEAKAVVERRGMTVSNATARMPVSELQRYMRRPAWASPVGVLTLSSKEFAWQPRNYRGTATLEWRDAAIALGGVHLPGTYRALLVGEGQQILFRIQTPGGVLRVAGDGSWSEVHGIAFEGEVHASGAGAAEAGAGLTAMAERLSPYAARGSGGRLRLMIRRTAGRP